MPDKQRDKHNMRIALLMWFLNHIFNSTSVNCDSAGFGRVVKINGRIAMPKGPRGEKRPADAIGNAVMIAQIATGEIKDNQKSGRVNSGKAGAKARAENLTSEKRSKIARKAANARWG